MNNIYEVHVTGIGEQVVDFIKEKMVVIFGEEVPKELHDIAVLHTGGKLSEDIQAGDILNIDGEEYKITAVGHTANQTIRDLGHATLNFNGSEKADLPGTIYLEEKPVPSITTSSVIRFVRK